MGNMTKSESIDVDITIETSDVLEFIEKHASQEDRLKIAKELNQVSFNYPVDRQLEGSLVRSMKSELLILAANKYSIQELEQRLGNKFDLI
jgi:hypothetical protein